MAKQLQAVDQMQATRARYVGAKTKKAIRKAADDLEFGSNKAAMLEVIVAKFAPEGAVS